MYDEYGYEMLPLEAFQPSGGRMSLFKKGDAPDAPDLRPLADAIRQVGEMQAKLGEKQYRFGVQQYEQNLPLYQRMVASSLEGQKLAMDLARESAADRQMYRPLAESLVADALRFDENRAKDVYAGRAAADYQQAADAALQSGIRTMGRYGVGMDPTRFKALNDEVALRKAAGMAGAMNNARLAAEAQGFNQKSAALGGGQVATGNMLNAINTGGSAAGTTSNLLGASAAPVWTGGNAYMTGLSNQSGALSSSANVMNMNYQNQLAKAQADAQNSPWGAIGQMGGMALSFLADGGQVSDHQGGVDANQDGGGGLLHGPGTGTSDSIQAINRDTGQPVMVSNGEYIISADVVRKIGRETLDKLQKKHHTPVRQAIRRS